MVQCKCSSRCSDLAKEIAKELKAVAIDMERQAARLGGVDFDFN